MLYKKVHRQHLRQFWEGRTGKTDDGIIFEVLRKPYICNDGFIRMYCDDCLRELIILSNGRMWYKNGITWID